LRKTKDIMDRAQRRQQEIADGVRWFHTTKPVPSVDDIVKRVKLEDLRREATGGDSVTAPAATRLISKTLVLFSFYEPRDLIASADYDRARRSLEVAARFSPLRGESCNLLVELNRRDPPRGRFSDFSACR